MGTERQIILNNIKFYLDKKQEKTETFAKKIGLSTGEFSKIMRGERQSFFKHLDKIAFSLGVNTSDLLKNNDETDINSERDELIDSLKKIIETCDERNIANLKLIDELTKDRNRWKELYDNTIKVNKSKTSHLNGDK